jgi:uncharacterized membrane protein
MASCGVMTPGSLSFAAQEWFWPALALLLLALLFVYFSYRRASISPGLRSALFFLKALGFALLLAFLLEPTWTTTRPREGVNVFALVADNSMGLQLRDAGAPESRGHQMRAALTASPNPWENKLEETFLLRRYLFDSRLESVRNFAELDFAGRSTALGSALAKLGERFQGQPLAGILLFTDGNATDLDEGVGDLAGLPPIYPVVIGRATPLRDVALEKVSATQTVFEDAPVTLSATVRASGFPAEKILAKVYLNGVVVAEQAVQAKKDDEEIPLRFQLKPERQGVSFYDLRLQLARGDTNLAEATLHNNSRVVAVDRGTGPHRILYVGGRPNWEYKFLNRAISEDPQVQLVSLIRIARREPKFTFRGRSGESSNPLFRGFNKIDEETERYDQPVLIRLNTRDEVELRAGFPKSEQELYDFEAVIIDDMEAEFFTPDQMLLVQRFVSERGGGFLMLGGVDTLQDGQYLRTPIGDMLPVYLDRVQEARGGAYRYDLTREGWLQAWLRLRSTEEQERERLDSLPLFRVLNSLREAKPGASILATVTDETGTSYPAVAVQRFGAGRVATVAIGDIYQGGNKYEKAAEDLGKTWRQMLRWLIADVPKKLEILAEDSAEDAVTINVRVRDEKFQPLENASVLLTVIAPGGNPETNRLTLAAEPSEREPGVYRATYIPRETGAYRATAVVADVNGHNLGKVPTGWASEPLAREFAALQPNQALLAEIARKTGGEVVSSDQLDSFVQTLKRRKAPIVETYSYPLWHKSSFFVLALLCFTGEWGVRRWKGLA